MLLYCLLLAKFIRWILVLVVVVVVVAVVVVAVQSVAAGSVLAWLSAHWWCHQVVGRLVCWWRWPRSNWLHIHCSSAVSQRWPYVTFWQQFSNTFAPRCRYFMLFDHAVATWIQAYIYTAVYSAAIGRIWGWPAGCWVKWCKSSISDVILCNLSSRATCHPVQLIIPCNLCWLSSVVSFDSFSHVNVADGQWLFLKSCNYNASIVVVVLMCDETSCNYNVVVVLMCDETSCNYILLRLLTSDFDVLRFIRDARLLRNQFVSGSSDVSAVSYSQYLA